MVTESASLVKSPSSQWVPGLAAALGLVALCLAMFSAPWWLDRLGTYQNTTELADLDGDGDLDVVLHNLRRESELTAFGATTLWMNDGRGRFSPRELGTELPPFLYLDAAGGDVDRDGDADLLFLSPDHLRLVLNLGGAQGGETGMFGVNNPIKPLGYTGTPGSVVLGDLNGDGQVDGLVAGCCGMSWSEPSGERVDLPSISWAWINEWDPRGWLVRHSLDIPDLDGLPVRAALGDLDGDGDLDVLAAVQAPKPGGEHSPAGRVLLNDGAGRLRDSGQRLGEAGGTSAALADLDGDGDLDAVVGSQDGAQVWKNGGGAQGARAGVFAPGQAMEGSPAQAVFLDDLDGDGDPDALLGAKRQAVIWWNGGQGTFTRSDERFRYSQRHGLAVGDLDGDGVSDIFAGAYGEAYSAWLNRGDGTFQTGLFARRR